jgi:adapter protein MecA 1/2
MKIEKISDYKVKITINSIDLEERNIDMDDLVYNSPKAQELFWDILYQAYVEQGFEVRDEQLVVEAIPNSRDTFVIIITKYRNRQLLKPGPSKFIKGSDAKKAVKSKEICFCFNDLEDIISLSKRIIDSYKGDSSAYKHKDNYYLVLKPYDTYPSILVETIAEEYGCRCKTLEVFLKEYGSTLIENSAVEILAWCI